MRFSLLLAGFCALALSACATGAQSASAPAGGDCFRTADISGYDVVDDHHVNVHLGPGRDYIMTTLFNTHDLNWTSGIAVRSHSDWICTGSGASYAEVIGGRPRRSFPVTEIQRAPPPPAQGS